MTLNQFAGYVESVKSDETPLFIFDKHVDNKLKSWRSDRMFERLNISDEFRNCLEPDFWPDKRWLLVGNQRSGSKWHKDPNMTS